jgi:ribokinase
VADFASKAGKKVILNPAPAQPLTSSLLQNLYMITPNETEAEMISGVKITDNISAVEAARAIGAMGVQNVVITLGAKGALIYTKEDGGSFECIPALKVDAVDTTAAGDIFNGALAVALSERNTDMYNIYKNGKKIIDIASSEQAMIADAVHFACKVAAISVTRLGAQSSAPYRNEVDFFVNHK